MPIRFHPLLPKNRTTQSASVEAKPEIYTLAGPEEDSGKCGRRLLGIDPSWSTTAAESHN